jgi:hypothetical protein
MTFFELSQRPDQLSQILIYTAKNKKHEKIKISIVIEPGRFKLNYWCPQFATVQQNRRAYRSVSRILSQFFIYFYHR